MDTAYLPARLPIYLPARIDCTGGSADRRESVVNMPTDNIIIIQANGIRTTEWIFHFFYIYIHKCRDCRFYNIRKNYKNSRAFGQYFEKKNSAIRINITACNILLINIYIFFFSGNEAVTIIYSIQYTK